MGNSPQSIPDSHPSTPKHVSFSPSDEKNYMKDHDKFIGSTDYRFEIKNLCTSWIYFNETEEQNYENNPGYTRKINPYISYLKFLSRDIKLVEKNFIFAFESIYTNPFNPSNIRKEVDQNLKEFLAEFISTPPAEKLPDGEYFGEPCCISSAIKSYILSDDYKALSGKRGIEIIVDSGNHVGTSYILNIPSVKRYSSSRALKVKSNSPPGCIQNNIFSFRKKDMIRLQSKNDENKTDEKSYSLLITNVITPDEFNEFYNIYQIPVPPIHSKVSDLELWFSRFLNIFIRIILEHGVQMVS